MLKHLIVFADGKSGRGTRGLSLYWFLKTFHGGAVRVVSSSDLRGAGLACETLFVGMPTKLRRDDLADVKYRRLVLFDYEDSDQLFVDDDTRFLAEHTVRYLKAWNETQWQRAPWVMGVLPIRRQARLPWYLKWLRLKSAFGARPPEREWDVSFLGSPTGWDTGSQRVVWLREIKGHGKHRFWGGLAASDKIREVIAQKGINADDVFYEGGRVNFTKFFDVMRRSKCVLTPRGNARWSYRHYEAIYAGAIPVSCDMRHANVLIPLPMEGMVNVPDDAPVLGGIETALGLAKRAEVREANVAFLERYLTDGDYDRAKPELLERFSAQLG